MDRLHCRCAFSDGAQKLGALLDTLEQTIGANTNHRRAIKEAQDALAALRQEHKEHVTRYREEQNRSLVEHLKRTAPPLKTSAWTAGDIETLRNVPTRSRTLGNGKEKRGKGSKRKREHALLAQHEKITKKPA